MQLEYEITKEDVVEFRMNIVENTKRLQNSFFYKRFGLATIFLVTPFVINIFRGDIPHSMFPLFTIPFFLWIFLYPIYHKKRFKKFFFNNTDNNKKYKNLIGKHILTIDSKKIVNLSEKKETKLRWDKVKEINKNKQYVFIYTSESMGIIVPARVFEDQKSFKEFEEVVKNYYKESTQK